MTDDFKTFPSRSSDPYLRYESSSSSERPKNANKKLPVSPRLGELKPRKVAFPHHFRKLFSGMWGLVQKVIESTHEPIATKTPANPLGTNQQDYVTKCFASFTDNFKVFYENISNRPSS